MLSKLSRYDTDTATPELEFKHDYVVFQYFNVPYSVFRNLMSSSRKGAFFQKTYQTFVIHPFGTINHHPFF
ncbi:MAG: KTSC domain-containing protein [Methanosphaera stadtmanae]|nr:KTSC domain-containing protein [Methanosphaera stadtmanae]